MKSKEKIVGLLVPLFIFLATHPAFATGGASGMPWESPLSRILSSITGPVAKAGGILAIVAAGLGLAFSEGGGFMRKVVGVVFGLAITFSATTFISDFLGYTGGVRF
ncbi:TrbC/VirB2 family protein [Geomonas anaerohicana]|uniref:TrbC/VirB2 family protein n=1 Tax=Geomonas anaerohicana TaxID=2798583 RepID=A0ABS0YC89_9BACT|nr:TrbC/VirB2 family protein [Geomonas anaerohicana]MBJ6749923.1 TrbC/VirB2 family protein [Geomonas anaerohicana]